MLLRQGDVLEANIPGDPHNPRPVVVIFPPLPDDPDGTVGVIGISTKFDEPPPAHWIRIPARPGGHPITKLTRECVAKCDWAIEIQINAIVRKQNETPDWVLKKMLEQIARLESDSEE